MSTQPIEVGKCADCGQVLLLIRNDCWHPWDVRLACPPEPSDPRERLEWAAAGNRTLRPSRDKWLPPLPDLPPLMFGGTRFRILMYDRGSAEFYSARDGNLFDDRLARYADQALRQSEQTTLVDYYGILVDGHGLLHRDDALNLAARLYAER